MDRDGHTGIVAEPDRGEEMRVERVHAAVADEPDEVQGPPGLLERPAEIDKRRQLEELSRFDGLRNPHHVLGDDATSPEVQVSDFAVADLPLRKPDRQPRSVQQGSRSACPEAVPGGRVAQLDGVAFTARAEPPAVKDDEPDRGALPTQLRHIGGVQCSQVLRALPVVICLGALVPPGKGLAAQARFRVTGEGEWLYQQPEGKRLAHIAQGSELAGGEQRGDWQSVRLDGWIFAPSVAATARAGADLAVTRAPDENLRDSPSGTLIAKLPQGFLLSKVGDDHRWVHVQRVGWMKRGALEEVAAVVSARTAAPDTDSTKATASTPDSAAADLARAQSARRTTLYRAPGGPEAGTVGQSTSLRVVSRSGEWTRVQLEGWVKTADLAAEGQGVLVGVTAAELRTDPQRFIGQSVRWTLQYIAIQQADELRPEIPAGGTYLLTRGPLPERGFVYVFVPDAKQPLVASLTALSVIQVTARVRAGRSHYLGNPVVDLVSLEVQPEP
jgi:hypothetical protein